MKIKYEFMTGERLELEVDDNIGEIMIEMEKTQSRRNGLKQGGIIRWNLLTGLWQR